MLKSGSNAQIDYTVYLPLNVELSIELKFGNLYMTDHNSKTTVYLSNGDFRGGNFNDLALDHSFGIVHLDSMRTGSMTLAYSELRMKHAGNIRISSKSSRPEISSFHNIRLNSKRDTYFFKKAGTISGETSFSYLTLEKLDGDLMLTMNYGNLDIGGYGKNFSLLNLNAEYTDVKLICSTAGSYAFEAYYNRKTKMIYPVGSDKFDKKEMNGDEGAYLVTGYCGNDKEDAPRIKLTMNGGSVNLIQQ
jgi:hypothetical protein